MMQISDKRFPLSPSTMAQSQFVDQFGGVYEHSPWVAETAAQRGLAAHHDTVDGLCRLFRDIVDHAEHEKRLTLIRAHPDLAGKVAARGELTTNSSFEQASAGIDQCTAEEFEAFQKLNDLYRQKFGFPFVMAVKGSNKNAILAEFERRVDNEYDVEFERALDEIHKIARLRVIQISEDETARPFEGYIDLAQPRLGTRCVYATDEFFAAKERLIDPAPPIFIPDKFDDHGKWMDGWESRRKRDPGHDYCIVRLGVPGMIRGFDIDTTHFTGNYPPAASIEACVSDDDTPGNDANWHSILPRVDLVGDSHHNYLVEDETHYTHLKLNIYPDGGVARLRVFGLIKPDWSKFSADQELDLVALENGGQAVACNDEHYGTMHNLNAPGRGVNMGDGWETARRRGPGHDWVILKLGHPGSVTEVEIDTAHFKGNYPDRASIQAADCTSMSTDQLVAESGSWPLLLPEVKLSADSRHRFSREIEHRGKITHVRLNIFPDGGVSRIRLRGHIKTEMRP